MSDHLIKISTIVDNDVIPAISEFIKIENQSRDFDPDWETNGLLIDVCTLAINYFNHQELKNAEINIYKEDRRTPLIIATINSDSPYDSKSILMYGHLDKQPPMRGKWSEGLDPYVPVIKNNKLYGRGSTDDGYAFFSTVSLIKYIQDTDSQKYNFVLVFETDEESGSNDIIYYLEKYFDIVKNVSTVICLDSTTIDYERFYKTNSLRGFLEANVKVSVTSQGVHSGDASGVISDSFRIFRSVLERIENQNNQEIKLKEFYDAIPPQDYENAEDLILEIGDKLNTDMPLLEGVDPITKDKFTQYLNQTWRPQLTIVGLDGIPICSEAGNVLRPFSEFTLSFRLPPTVNCDMAEKALLNILDSSNQFPYNAKINVKIEAKGNGFLSGVLKEDLNNAISKASKLIFNKEIIGMACGGSIPFMNELRKLFPDADFLVTGVDGPNSNMHAPDEALDIEYLKKFLTVLYISLSNN